MLATTVPYNFLMPTFPRLDEKAAGMYVLIVDGDAAVRTACCEIVARLGYLPHGVDGPAAARGLLRNNSIDILLLDLPGTTGDGLALLEEIKALHPETAVVVMSAFATVPSAVEAMRTGANDLLTKPFASDELGSALERAAERRTLDLAGRRLRERLRTQQGMGSIIGRSPEMEKLYRILSKVAQSGHPALILGESGTGKELVARSIHACGPNASKPFIPVDCGSLVPTLIESELFGHVKGAFTGANRAKDGLLASAGSGTVFLDEIGELPLDLQARLLRALQEKEVRPVGATHSIAIHARVLAATNRDLAALVEQGRFRKDLFYRLNVVNLRIPPLRERRADIPLLAAHFLDRLARETTTSPTKPCAPWSTTNGRATSASSSTPSSAAPPSLPGRCCNLAIFRRNWWTSPCCSGARSTPPVAATTVIDRMAAPASTPAPETADSTPPARPRSFPSPCRRSRRSSALSKPSRATSCSPPRCWASARPPSIASSRNTVSASNASQPGAEPGAPNQPNSRSGGRNTMTG
jgi:DNA-binding NtrC family response regulator